MPQPFLQLEQAHWLLRIEQLRGDGRSCPMTRNFPAKVVLGYTCFATQPWNEPFVHIADPGLSHLVKEQEVDHLPCFVIAQLRLWRPHLLPCIDRLTHRLVNGLRKSRASLVHRNIK